MYPFQDDDDSDDRLLRFPHVKMIGLVAVALLAIFGLWRLVSHRHEAAQEPESVTASADEPSRNRATNVRDEQRTSADNAKPGKTQYETAFEKSRALVDKTKDFTPKQIFSLSLNEAKEILGEPLDSGEPHVIELGAEAGEKWIMYSWGSYTTSKHSEDDLAIIVLSMDFGPDHNIRDWVRMKPYLVDGRVKKEWVDEYTFINGKWLQVGHKPGEPRYRQVDF